MRLASQADVSHGLPFVRAAALRRRSRPSGRPTKCVGIATGPLRHHSQKVAVWGPSTVDRRSTLRPRSTVFRERIRPQVFPGEWSVSFRTPRHAALLAVLPR